MAAPRRAAAPDDATLADLGTVAPARRAAAPAGISRARLTRMVLAPVAVLSVTGLAAGLMFLPPDEPGTTEAGTTAAQAAPMNVSRSQIRPELTQSPTPTATRQAPLDTAAPALAEEPTAESPTPDPAPVTPTATPVQDSAVSDEAVAGAEEPTEAAPEPTAEETTAEPTAEATTADPTPEPTEEPTPEAPAIDYTELGEAAGSRYASASVNVRTGPGTDFDVRTTVAEGTEVAITDLEIDGWRQIAMKERAGWIKASFLTETRPEVKSSGTSGTAGGFSTQPCAKAAGVEKGLTERTRAVLRAVCAQFPDVSSYGGRRAGGGNHGAGKAIDVMVSGEYGWEIARWLRSNAHALGVTEVIYEQKIWTTQRAGDGWRGMANRGSVSANHYDHVHISVR